MKKILLGIDIGTSACKAVAFDPSGEVLARATEEYAVYYPKPGYVEQNPVEWWEAVCRAIKSLCQSGIDAGEIAGIGIDGQSWSAIAIDKEGSVLTNTPIWMDTRSEDICKKLINDFGEDRLFGTSGNPVQPMYTLPKILWYKENLPEVYAKIDKVLQSSSFIAFMLTGAITGEPSQGYGFNCYNMKENRYDFELCKEIGIDPNFLPPIVPCHSIVGGVTAKAAELTGLKEGTPVVAGGLDAACGTLGAGVVKPGQTQEQGGQAGGMSICMDECHMDKRLILGAHVVPNHWLLQGGTVGGSGALRWFEQEFGAMEREMAKEKGTNSFIELSREAETIAPGSDGLVFLPYMSGERSPIWDSKAKGIFYGIDFSKTRAHFARAVMEGVAYSLRHNLEAAKEAGADVDVLSAVGGAANSKVWMQLKADITGKTIVVPTSDTATAFGAAILAGVGVGIYADFESAVRDTVTITAQYIPNKENEAVYDEGYRMYRKLYNNLRED